MKKNNGRIQWKEWSRTVTPLRIEAWGKYLALGIYWTAFAALLVLMLQKCRYGYVSPDEGFYLVTPYRFIQGDRMLLDEWHFSQFASFTMIPEVWLYLKLAGTTESMLLNFRYLYTLFWSMASAFLYFRCRTIQKNGARLASLFMMCYAPYGIMAFSYNSLGILYLVNAAIFLLCARRHQRLQFFVSGVFFAGAVLCCPYLAAIYLFYSFRLGICLIRKKKRAMIINGQDALTCWKYFTLGVCVLSVLFLRALCAGTSPGLLLSSLSEALQDEEHPAFSVTVKVISYFQGLWQSNDLFLPCVGIILAMTGLNLYHKNAAWLCIASGAIVVYLRRFMQVQPYINLLMLPMTLLGVYVWFATRQRKIREVGIYWLLPGILYTFCIHCSSNQGILAVSSAATVSSAAAFLMLGMYCDELSGISTREKKERKQYLTAWAAVLACFLFQMRYEVPMRWQTVFQEPGLMQYEDKMTVDRGSQKGIIATVRNAERYQELFHDLEGITHQPVLFLSGQTWMYLENGNQPATFSAWLGSINNGWDKTVSDTTIKRLRSYYAARKKLPTMILTEKDNLPFVINLFSEINLSTTQLNETDWLIRLQ